MSTTWPDVLADVLLHVDEDNIDNEPEVDLVFESMPVEFEDGDLTDRDSNPCFTCMTY